MGMFKKLWHLFVKKRKPSLLLQCRIPDKSGFKLSTYTITGAFGMRLYGVLIDNPNDYRLIGEGEVLDRDHFWSIWKWFSGDGWKWEDGTSFRPR